MITSQQTTQRSTDTLTLHKIHFSLAQTEVQLPHVRFHITVSIVSQQNINYVALSFLIDLRTFSSFNSCGFWDSKQTPI